MNSQTNNETNQPKPTRVDVTPTRRTISGRVVCFYSPNQIEEIVPVDLRLARQQGDHVYSIGSERKGKREVV